ncbi:MAG: TatD family hydrolase, partial [Cumulibacter sp.]
NVLGIGEIGLNKNTRSELAIFEEHLALAKEHSLPVLIHTPHLEDKLKGTRLILDALKNAGADPGATIIDHVEEHTAPLVLDAGFWAGLTLYPESKCSPARAIDILETYGMERVWMNSACDWGVSDPLSVINCALEMRRRDHSPSIVEKVIYHNPRTFLSQCPNFKSGEPADKVRRPSGPR